MQRQYLLISIITLVSLASAFLFAVKAKAPDITVKNIETTIQNMLDNAAQGGDIHISGNGNAQTGDTTSQSVISNTVNTTVVTCCTTPTQAPKPTEQVTPTQPPGQPSPTPTSQQGNGGGNGGGGNGGGDNGDGGGGIGGGDVQGVSHEQGDILGLAVTSSAPITASTLQGIGLLCVGVGLMLKKRLGSI